MHQTEFELRLMDSSELAPKLRAIAEAHNFYVLESLDPTWRKLKASYIPAGAFDNSPQDNFGMMMIFAKATKQVQYKAARWIEGLFREKGWA